MRPLLGTFVELAVDDENLSSSTALHHAFNSGFRAITDVQTALSFHRADSELSRINLYPKQWLNISHLSLRVLQLAKALTELSGGLFNYALGQELVARKILPDHGFGERQKCADANVLSFSAGKVRLNDDALICLDGIAKGYAVDLAIVALKRSGIKAGYINAGGDLRVFGQCRIPVQLAGKNEPSGLLCNAAIATSNSDSSEQFPGLLLSGEGNTLPSGRWSVIASSAWRADALTKVAAASNGNSALVASLGGRLVHSDA